MREALVVGPERLDDPAEVSGDLGGLCGGLPAVQLHTLDTCPVRQLDHSARQLVAEHAHRQDLGGQSAGDVVGLLRGDLALRRREDEPDRVGAHRNRQEGHRPRW